MINVNNINIFKPTVKKKYIICTTLAIIGLCLLFFSKFEAFLLFKNWEQYLATNLFVLTDK